MHVEIEKKKTFGPHDAALLNAHMKACSFSYLYLLMHEWSYRNGRIQTHLAFMTVGTNRTTFVRIKNTVVWIYMQLLPLTCVM